MVVNIRHTFVHDRAWNSIPALCQVTFLSRPERCVVRSTTSDDRDLRAIVNFLSLLAESLKGVDDARNLALYQSFALTLVEPISIYK